MANCNTGKLSNLINKCSSDCNCKTVNYDCIPACTYTKLTFTIPEPYIIDNFNNIWFVISDNFNPDTQPLLYANSIESPENFDLTNNTIILNSSNAPCEFCVDGGRYSYEITGDIYIDGNEETKKIILIQCGIICVKQSLRQSIIPCDE